MKNPPRSFAVDFDLVVTGLEGGVPTYSRLSTGYVDLDEALGGIRGHSLYTVSGYATTSFVLGMAVHMAATSLHPVLYVSTQTTTANITRHILAAEAQLPRDRVDKSELLADDWQRISAAQIRLTSGLHLRAATSIDVTELESQLHELTTNDNFEAAAIIIDDLDTVAPSTVAARVIESRLKQMAMRLGTPVIVVTSTGSSSLSADVCLELDYRRSDRSSSEVTVLSRKNRFGQQVHKQLMFFPAYGRFDNSARPTDS
jgi:replicative DNA helicase